MSTRAPAEAAGFRADDAGDVEALIVLIKTAGRELVARRRVVGRRAEPWTVTTGGEVLEGSYRYVFRAQAGEGVYTSVQPAEVPRAQRRRRRLRFRGSIWATVPCGSITRSSWLPTRSPRWRLPPGKMSLLRSSPTSTCVRFGCRSNKCGGACGDVCAGACGSVGRPWAPRAA